MPVKLLIQHNYSLSPRLAAKLSCSCFHGRPGKNIPVDLHMEHLNKIAKGAIRLSGSNKHENTITRIGRVIGTLSPALENADRHLDCRHRTSERYVLCGCEQGQKAL